MMKFGMVLWLDCRNTFKASAVVEGVERVGDGLCDRGLEDDLAGAGADELRHRVSGILDQLADDEGLFVGATRVRLRNFEQLSKRTRDLGSQRRG